MYTQKLVSGSFVVLSMLLFSSFVLRDGRFDIQGGRAGIFLKKK